MEYYFNRPNLYSLQSRILDVRTCSFACFHIALPVLTSNIFDQRE
uniref:Uncharacterized protein n=1 Tax=Arundo donax TaxID=35708 RepID=A0A0A9E7A3_ARUDO